MRFVSTRCPSCGGQLEVDLGARKASCPACGSLYLVDDEARWVDSGVAAQPQATAQPQAAEQPRAAAQPQAAEQPQATTAEGPAAARADEAPKATQKRRVSLWRVLGWLIFPFVMVVILLVRKKDLNPVVRVTGILVSVALAAFFYIGPISYAGSKSSGGDSTVMVAMPQSSSSLKGMHYSDVVHLLEEAGFTDIQTREDADLWVAVLHSDGDVEKVTVGGDSYFSEGDRFAADDPVVVKYHTYRNKSKRESSEEAGRQDD